MIIRPTAARAPVLRKQHGLSLVEVLVAMTVGLVLLGGVGYMFIGSKQMNTAQTDAVRLQESTRNALDVVGTAVRQAGYRLDMDELALDATAIEGTVGAGVASDTLIIRHDPNWVVDVPAGGALPNKIAGRERNCEGVDIASNNGNDAATGAKVQNTNLIVYQFRVVGGKLMCYASDNATPPGGVVVADNVERMKVSYGIGDGKEAVTSYVTAPSATELPRVTAVRLSLLLRGPSGGVAVGSQTVLFNDANVTTNDGHLRRVVTSTFNVRNRARFN
jgi:type IV pilus assembly protein PilW